MPLLTTTLSVHAPGCLQGFDSRSQQSSHRHWVVTLRGSSPRCPLIHHAETRGRCCSSAAEVCSWAKRPGYYSCDYSKPLSTLLQEICREEVDINRCKQTAKKGAIGPVYQTPQSYSWYHDPAMRKLNNSTWSCRSNWNNESKISTLQWNGTLWTRLVLFLSLRFCWGQNISCRSKFLKLHFLLLFALALSFWLLHNAQHLRRVKITKLKPNILMMPLGKLTEWGCKTTASENPPSENCQPSPARRQQLPVIFTQCLWSTTVGLVLSGKIIPSKGRVPGIAAF